MAGFPPARQPTLKAARPSFLDRVQFGLADALQAVGALDGRSHPERARRFAQRATALLRDVTPVGAAPVAEEAKREFGRGNWGTGSGLAVLSAIAALPGPGKGASAVIRKVARGKGFPPARAIATSAAKRAEIAKELGYTTDAYHGTARPDRIIEKGGFDPKRATSGPMPFFTDSPVMASGYATGKQDTSRIAEDLNDYSDWFKTDVGRGKPKTLRELWWNLTPEQQGVARSSLGKVTQHDDYLSSGQPNPLAGQFYLGEGPGGQSHWQHTLREQGGDPIKAAQDVWLNSGNLYDQEEKFVDVMRTAGVDVPLRFDSPHLTNPGVIPVKLRMGNTLDTTDPYTMRHLLQEVEGAAKGKRYKTSLKRGVDMWDKQDIGLPEFRDQLRLDIAEGRNPTSFTRIPDDATNVMKSMGFESVTDTGGKMGGEGHNVFIPFSPQQVRSRFAPFEDADPTSPYLLGEWIRRNR